MKGGSNFGLYANNIVSMTAEPQPGALEAREETRRVPKTSEIVAREIVQHIVDNDLPEGTRLPTERDMLQSLNVGRATLREALRQLETSGVITIRTGRNGGPTVRRPRMDDLSSALTLILQFEKASLRDVLQARKALEPMLARLAAENIEAEQLSMLRSSIDDMLNCLSDRLVFRRHIETFHTLIAEASGNLALRAFAGSLKAINDGAMIGVEYSLGRRKATAAAHERILKALENRDGNAAEREMRDHLDGAGRFWQSKYGGLFDTPVNWV